MSDWIDRAVETRKAIGITQEALGERMGATQGYVSNIERRKKGYRLDTVHKFAKALGVEFSELYHGENSVVQQGSVVPLIDRERLKDWLFGASLDSGKRVVCPTANRGARVYALVIEGDAMEPDYRDKSIVYVDPDEEKRHGKNAVYVTKEGVARVRKTTLVDGVEFMRPVNTQYRAEPITDNEIYCGEITGSYREE